MLNFVKKEYNKLKQVLVVYDNLMHEPKINNLFTFRTINLFEYKNIFIMKSEDILNLFIENKPDILLIDVSFNDLEVFSIISNISIISKKTCGIIVISSSSTLRKKLFDSKIPDRIFPQNISIDVIEYTLKELSTTLDIPFKNYFYKNLIDGFYLNPYSPTTMYFISNIKVACSNPFLLSGHINNIFYTVSKEYNISVETARKSVYKVISLVNLKANPSYIRSIFGNYDLNNISPSNFLEMIVWKLKIF